MRVVVFHSIHPLFIPHPSFLSQTSTVNCLVWKCKKSVCRYLYTSIQTFFWKLFSAFVFGICCEFSFVNLSLIRISLECSLSRSLDGNFRVLLVFTAPFVTIGHGYVRANTVCGKRYSLALLVLLLLNHIWEIEFPYRMHIYDKDTEPYMC